MKNLNELIFEYTKHLQKGEMQIAYKGIMDFLGKLRAELVKKYPYYDVSSIYQGYMDMSYFSFSTKSLKEKGLKVCIVYLHNKGNFEVWLSARNRDIAKDYISIFDSNIAGDLNFFHDKNNPDAIIESILAPTPNFEDQSSLIDIIFEGVEKFLIAIGALL